MPRRRSSFLPSQPVLPPAVGDPVAAPHRQPQTGGRHATVGGGALRGLAWLGAASALVAAASSVAGVLSYRATGAHNATRSAARNATGGGAPHGSAGGSTSLAWGVPVEFVGGVVVCRAAWKMASNAAVVGGQWYSLRLAAGGHLDQAAWTRWLRVSLAVVPLSRGVAVLLAPVAVDATAEERSTAYQVMAFVSMTLYYASLVGAFLVCGSAIRANGHSFRALASGQVEKQHVQHVSDWGSGGNAIELAVAGGDGGRESTPNTSDADESKRGRGIGCSDSLCARRDDTTFSNMVWVAPVVLMCAYVGRILEDTWGITWWISYVIVIPLFMWVGVVVVERNRVLVGDPASALVVSFGITSIPSTLGYLMVGQLTAAGADDTKKLVFLLFYNVVVAAVAAGTRRNANMAMAGGSGAAMYVLYFAFTIEYFLELAFVSLEPFGAAYFVLLCANMVKIVVVRGSVYKDAVHSIRAGAFSWAQVDDRDALEGYGVALEAEAIGIADAGATVCVMVSIATERIVGPRLQPPDAFITMGFAKERTVEVFAAYVVVLVLQLCASHIVRRIHIARIAASTNRARIASTTAGLNMDQTGAVSSTNPMYADPAPAARRSPALQSVRGAPNGDDAQARTAATLQAMSRDFVEENKWILCAMVSLAICEAANAIYGAYAQIKASEAS